MEGFSGLNDEYEFNHESVSTYSDHNVVRGLIDTPLDHDNNDLPFPVNVTDHEIGNITSFSNSFDADFTEENDFSDAVLKYINEVLMEDDLEDKAYTIQDSTLRVTEKSFYDILNNTPPPLHNQPLHHQDASSSDASVCSNCGNSLIDDFCMSSHVPNPSVTHTFQLNSLSLCPLISSSCHTVDGLMESLADAPLENRCSLQFVGGIEERKKVLPNGNSGILDLENSRLSTPEPKKKVMEGKAKAEMDEGELSNRGRKSHHHQDESDLEEGRSNKHLAVYAEESVLQEMFDKIFLFNEVKDQSLLNSLDGALPNGASRESHQTGQATGYNGGMSCSKKRVTKREAVDMRSLLLQCMQSVAGNDHRSASKLLKQIRLRSSPSGDGSQRLAHCFANGLEARLAGTGGLMYKDLAAKNMSTSDAFKAYKLYISAFPFMKSLNYLATQTILGLAEKATSLHIIHFGIGHGLQFPPLIQRLSARPGGSPKLHVTGIDFPNPGFRPAAIVEETGHRLANYCQRLNVPFEYSGIAKEWETITPEDLKLGKDEVVVVHCSYRSHFLLDDTILENSPRDAVLNLIKRINPDIFIHGVKNGAYNSPFFVLRFRQALFYFSALFDLFEASVPRLNRDRMMYETGIYGKEVLNVIACEGLERIERPETYKQWQVRTVRAGFRQLPLNQEILKKVKAKVKSSYHKHFFVDEASQWMLQGWKGRVIFALSCWKPA